MRLSLGVKVAAVSGVAAGATLSAVLLTAGSHAAPSPLMVRQDAATVATSTTAGESSPARVAAPKLSPAASTVAVKHAEPQENTVTDPTSTPPQPALPADPVDTSSDANNAVTMTGAATTEPGGVTRAPQPPPMISASGSPPIHN